MNVPPVPERFEGVRVFGSSLVRVAPDSATIAVTVSRLDMDPSKAFASARTSAVRSRNF